VISEKSPTIDLDLDFSAMAAAYTFEDILTYLPKQKEDFRIRISTEEIPMTSKLAQNYPNPFNPTTGIQYQLPKQEYVSLTIYNVVGQAIKELVSDNRAAGSYTVLWDGTDESGKSVPAGIYFYKIRAGDFIDCKKMLLVK